MRTFWRFVAVPCLFLVLSCSDDENKKTVITFGFDADLDGWSVGTSGKDLDDVDWIDHTGLPPGAVKMDGSDFGTSDHEPNSWIFMEIAIPETATLLSFDTATHDRQDANAELRVRAVDQNQVSTTLIDWELGDPGIEGEFVWIQKEIGISQFAGETVTLFFEQGDNDIGINEQRYLDNITIE